jgi:3-oxoacyl-(acyl-carrier-protein) synthase
VELVLLRRNIDCLIERGPSKIGPFLFTKMIGNMAAGQAAIFLEQKDILQIL